MRMKQSEGISNLTEESMIWRNERIHFSTIIYIVQYTAVEQV